MAVARPSVPTVTLMRTTPVASARAAAGGYAGFSQSVLKFTCGAMRDGAGGAAGAGSGLGGGAIATGGAGGGGTVCTVIVGAGGGGVSILISGGGM